MCENKHIQLYITGGILFAKNKRNFLHLNKKGILTMARKPLLVLYISKL